MRLVYLQQQAVRQGNGKNSRQPLESAAPARPPAHRRSLSAHSAAIASAPWLFPLATMITVMGMGRTERARGCPPLEPAAETAAVENRRGACWCLEAARDLQACIG